MTQHAELFAALAAPFEVDEVKSRSQAGRTFSYITARTVQNRLDNVLGPENWWNRFIPGEKSVLCELTIRLPDGSTLTKVDAGGYAGMSDAGDDEKSGMSDAFKRAGVMLGIGRYLYLDGVPEFVAERYPALDGPACPVARPGAVPRQSPSHAPANDPGRSESGYAPRWGNAPEPDRAPHREPGGDDERGEGERPASGRPPRSGKALYAWTRDMEKAHQVGLLKYLNAWAKMQEFPSRMVDFSGEQVRLAYEEAVRKLETIQADPREVYGEAPAY